MSADTVQALELALQKQMLCNLAAHQLLCFTSLEYEKLVLSCLRKAMQQGEGGWL
jgi:hypothetical protein